MTKNNHSHIIITGVSGTGKTTIGTELASILGFIFLDGDDFHSDENRDKMSNGIPLTDDDRAPWLSSLNQQLINSVKPTVLACSALKEEYRTSLAIKCEHILWVHLQGSYETIFSRLQSRGSHFMKSNMLTSQLETYQNPKSGIFVDIDNSKKDILHYILQEINMNERLSKFGLVGLGVMGTSLARNIASKQFSLSIFNRRVEGKEEKIAQKAVEKYAELKDAKPFEDLDAFVLSLETPRSIMLMVNAGKPTDEIIQEILPHLAPGDTLIDGGNSHYQETERRQNLLSEKGVNYLGVGVSGGEEGALKGPAIMPGGQLDAFKRVEEIFKTISAVNNRGEYCCEYIGKGGAGHFVKMVHNGIEYAEMQLIAEVYGTFRHEMALPIEEIAAIFSEWNKGINKSYLLEITADLLLKKDDDQTPLVDKILDSAGNKGTGGWTTVAASELGVAVPTLTTALFARYQSSYLETRKQLNSKYSVAKKEGKVDVSQFENLLYFARLINHHQGFDLIKAASEAYGWDVNLASLSKIWSAGCIIRSTLLEELRKEFELSANEILSMKSVSHFYNSNEAKVNEAYLNVLNIGAAVPCISASMEYFKYMARAESTANIIQAQRDYFGAHTYKRKDKEGVFHTIWKD